MLKATDSHAFVKAQQSEIQELHDSSIFSYHDISSLPQGSKLLNTIWSYCRKRNPAGDLNKYKAWICIDGFKQQYGIDYWETYAPVVSWSTVHLLITMASLHGLHSQQLDFAQAFTQPPITKDIYMKVPQGWQIVGGSLHQHTDPRFWFLGHNALKKN